MLQQYPRNVLPLATLAGNVIRYIANNPDTVSRARRVIGDYWSDPPTSTSNAPPPKRKLPPKNLFKKRQKTSTSSSHNSVTPTPISMPKRRRSVSKKGRSRFRKRRPSFKGKRRIFKAKRSYGRRRGSQSKRAAIMDILQQPNNWSYTNIARYTSGGATTTDVPDTLSQLNSANRDGVSATVLGAAGTYPTHHLLAMAYICNSARGNLNDQFVVTGYSYVVKFTSASNAPIKLRLYTCLNREFQHHTHTPLEVYQQGMVEKGVNNPESGYYKNPFMSPEFCRTFKILKSKTHVIAPGKTVTKVMKSNRRRIFRPAKFINPADQTYNYQDAGVISLWAKNHRFYVFQLEGQVVEPEAASGNISLAASEITVQQKWNYNFKCVAPTRAATYGVANQGYVANTTNNKFINTLTGAVENVTFT